MQASNEPHYIMRKVTLIFVFLLAAQIGISQDWSPFVLNQNSYYKQQYADYTTVDNFLHDSVYIVNNKEVLCFNSERRPKLEPECYNSQKIKRSLGFYFIPNYRDSLLKENGIFSYDYVYSKEDNPFVFKPSAKLKESWITNGVTIKCTRVDVLDILGKQDSIKKFVCSGNGYNNVIFILSKSYGFIKFIPLKEFLEKPSSRFSPYYELIGYEKDGYSMGYTQPKFADYFHLSVGDMVFWQNDNDRNDSYYYTDSIITSFISPDSVYYKVQQTVYDRNGSISSVKTWPRYYTKKKEGAIVENSTSWYGFIKSKRQRFDMFYLNSLYIEIEDNDTITYANYSLPGSYIKPDDCYAGNVYDYIYAARFSTKLGIDYEYVYSWGKTSTTVVGSIIDGVKSGITDVPTGINQVKAESYKVYPNPCVNEISIDYGNKVPQHIEIYDALGNLLLKQESANTKINMSGLEPGIYILKITDSHNNISQVKIIKD